MTDSNLTPEERRALARRLRVEEGMSVTKLAERLGVHQTTIHGYLRGLPPLNTAATRSARAAARQRPGHNEAQGGTRRAEAFELRLTGLSPSKIAAQMGIHSTTVRGYIDAELTALVQPRAVEMRAMENERLDRLRVEAEAILHAGRGTELALKAIDRILNISRRYSALNGLDMPIRVDVQNTEKTQADLELDELLREAQARNAIVEAEIVGEVVDHPDAAE